MAAPAQSSPMPTGSNGTTGTAKIEAIQLINDAERFAQLGRAIQLPDGTRLEFCIVSMLEERVLTRRQSSDPAYANARILMAAGDQDEDLVTLLDEEFRCFFCNKWSSFGSDRRDYHFDTHVIECLKRLDTESVKRLAQQAHDSGLLSALTINPCNGDSINGAASTSERRSALPQPRRMDESEEEGEVQDFGNSSAHNSAPYYPAGLPSPPIPPSVDAQLHAQTPEDGPTGLSNPYASAAPAANNPAVSYLKRPADGMPTNGLPAAKRPMIGIANDQNPLLRCVKLLVEQVRQLQEKIQALEARTNALEDQTSELRSQNSQYASTIQGMEQRIRSFEQANVRSAGTWNKILEQLV